MLTPGMDNNHSKSFQCQRIELARTVVLQSSLEDSIVKGAMLANKVIEDLNFK